MAELCPALPRNDFHEPYFDPVRVFLFIGESHPVGDAKDVGIDDHTFIFPERVSQHDVGRFSRDPVKREEFFHRVRDLAAEIVANRPAGQLNAAGFVPIKSRRPHQLFNLADLRFGKIFRRPEPREQSRYNFIDPRIGALGGEDGRDQKLQRIFVFQRTDGVGISFSKPCDNFSRADFQVLRSFH